jgi:hypothetical protein
VSYLGFAEAGKRCLRDPSGTTSWLTIRGACEHWSPTDDLLLLKHVVAGSIPVSRSTPHQTLQRMQGEGRRGAASCF